MHTHRQVSIGVGQFTLFNYLLGVTVMIIPDTVIIGAGQAGLGISHFLQQNGLTDIVFEQLKDTIISEGFITEAEFTRFLALADNSSFAWREGLTMSVWGQ